MKRFYFLELIPLLYSIFVSAIFYTEVGLAQNLITFPDTLSGKDIYLKIQNNTKSFHNGNSTNTIAYNGNYLGPTIILNKNQEVSIHVENQLADTTTTHWHGLHVPPSMDGSPHNPILSGMTWSPHFVVKDKAATYWYHPHLHGKTYAQVMKGAAGLIIIRDEEEAAITLPRKYGTDDFPLVVQYQDFNSNTNQIETDDQPDNTILVNGTIDGILNIPAQVVRFRLLNASSLRIFRFGFSTGLNFYQIASDDGMMGQFIIRTRLTDVGNYNGNNNVNVFPNPVAENQYFEMVSNSKILNVELYDLQGVKRFSFKANENQLKLSTSNLQTDCILRITTERGIVLKKIWIK